jgi:hypothetical protein
VLRVAWLRAAAAERPLQATAHSQSETATARRPPPTWHARRPPAGGRPSAALLSLVAALQTELLQVLMLLLLWAACSRHAGTACVCAGEFGDDGVDVCV